MIKVANKYGVKIDVPNPKRQLKQAMPIWYHVATDQGMYGPNSKSGKCLRENHGVQTVEQCVQVARRLTDPDVDHVQRQDCECRPCIVDRLENGCDNPARCAAAARKAINRLYPKWQPAMDMNGDGLTLTRSRKQQNEEARACDDRITFDLSTSQARTLARAFRVFTKRDQTREAATRPPKPYQVRGEEVEVY
ncbi:hypothetical protein C8Q70DRAFT_883351, partial [Cubamyces menziesii]